MPGSRSGVRAAAALALGVAAMLWAAPATACRCAPRTLDAYFADAELVFIARVDASVAETEHRTVRVSVQGRPFKGDPGTLAALRTPLSTATCGYALEPGRLYLVFASRRAADDSVAWFDTCNGTRPFEPGAGTAGEFIDAASESVLPRLVALRATAGGRDPRSSATPRLPRPGDPHARLIGLLELPDLLAAPDRTPAAEARTLAVFDAPDEATARAAPLRSADEVMTREVGYEQPAAVVRAQRPGWYRLALRDGDGWVRAADAGAFHPVAAALVDRLGYLTPHWDGWVWPDPGAGHPQLAPRVADAEQPATVRATAQIGDTLWLQVEVLERSPCADGTSRVVITGWVPAYTPDGELTAWFYSRGC